MPLPDSSISALKNTQMDPRVFFRKCVLVEKLCVLSVKAYCVQDNLLRGSSQYKILASLLFW